VMVSLGPKDIGLSFAGTVVTALVAARATRQAA